MKTGLVMEGGAMRGMFTMGVIDIMMEHGITYDGGIGVSAGRHPRLHQPPQRNSGKAGDHAAAVRRGRGDRRL